MYICHFLIHDVQDKVIKSLLSESSLFVIGGAIAAPTGSCSRHFEHKQLTEDLCSLAHYLFLIKKKREKADIWFQPIFARTFILIENSNKMTQDSKGPEASHDAAPSEKKFDIVSFSFGEFWTWEWGRTLGCMLLFDWNKEPVIWAAFWGLATHESPHQNPRNSSIK